MRMDQEFVDDLDALMQRHGVSARALRFWFVQGMEAAGERVPAHNPRAYRFDGNDAPATDHPSDHLSGHLSGHQARNPQNHHHRSHYPADQLPAHGHRPSPLLLPPMGAAPLMHRDDPAAAAIAALLDAYEPVQLERRRPDGWTPYAQRQFLVALAQGQSVDAAASAAGLGERAAYKLRSHPNGRRFARAWAKALDIAETIAAAQNALRPQPRFLP